MRGTNTILRAVGYASQSARIWAIAEEEVGDAILNQVVPSKACSLRGPRTADGVSSWNLLSPSKTGGQRRSVV
jgi:hypothetical protein